MKVVKARPIIGKGKGIIEGQALVTTEPICFLGGIDVHTGHTLLGQAVWRHQSRLDIERNTLRHRGNVLLREVA